MGYAVGLYACFLDFYRAMLCMRGTSHGPVSAMNLETVLWFAVACEESKRVWSNTKHCVAYQKRLINIL